MLDIFEQFAVNETRENEGTWMEMGDAEFLIARSGNKNYARMLTKAVERHKRALDRKDDAADKLSDQIMIDVVAKTILLDWKGVGYQGKELPYSEANAKMLLGIKDFRRQILELADDFDAFKAVEETEAGED